MGELIALEHVRRSKRLFGILIERYGLHYFLVQNGSPHPLALDADRFEQAIKFGECVDGASNKEGSFRLHRNNHAT